MGNKRDIAFRKLWMHPFDFYMGKNYNLAIIMAHIYLTGFGIIFICVF